jgi:RHS repeat-associated protein
VEANSSYTSLPWGDNQTPVANGTDANHYATLDHDSESNTDHAQFRQYSNTQGRFFSPDPYYGSYRMRNPQSFNRYVYAMNNPLARVDSLGLDDENGNPDENGVNDGGDGGSNGDSDGGSDGDDGGVYDNGNPTGDENGNPPAPLFVINVIEYDLVVYKFVHDGPLPWNAIPSFTSPSGGGGGGGGGGTGAPNNPIPWYKKKCVQNALLSGAGSVGIDAIGLIPEAGGVARVIGHQAGYVGVVADQLGHSVINAVGKSGSVVNTAANLTITPEGAMDAALTVAGFVPVLNDAAAVLSIGRDIYKTGRKISQCP